MKRRVGIVGLLAGWTLRAAAGADWFPLEDWSNSLTNGLAAAKLRAADLCFDKDVGAPDFALEWIREKLRDPIRFPERINILAAAFAAGPEEMDRLLRDWLEVGPLAAAPPPAAALDDPLERFLAETKICADLLARAFRDVAPDELRAEAAGAMADALELDDFPERRPALRAWGFTDADLDASLATAEAPDPAPEARRILAFHRRVDLGLLLQAGARWRAAVADLAARSSARDDWPARPTRRDTSWGPVWTGTRGADVYRGPALLILDPGGDDRYLDGAGVALGWGAEAAPYRALAAIVDLGGDDVYASDPVFGAGTAVGGLAALWDAAGDDRYASDGVGQAAAWWGYAWLEDEAGNDDYSARVHAQGAAVWGAAALVDHFGNDRYRVGSRGQGFAGARGFGLLCDRAGHDAYYAGGVTPDHERHPERFLSLAQGFSIGDRPFHGGGVGALYDAAGNDSYRADVYGQGASYWYSAGFLLDGAGHDEYVVYHYGQGAGIHLSLAALADRAGDDRYLGAILTQGCAHDYAVGLLLDGAGDDRYTADQYAQGMGINNAFGALFDGAGDDAYFALRAEECQGHGNDGGEREYPGLSLLLDRSGQDHYGSGAPESARTARGDVGVLADEDHSVVPVPPAPEAAPASADTPFEQLLRAATRYASTPAKRAAKDAARARLFLGGSAALRELMARIHRENIGIWLLARELADRLSAADCAPVWREFLDAPEPAARRAALYFAALQSTPDWAGVVPDYMARDTNLVAMGARALGKWRRTNEVSVILPLLTDGQERRRVIAANALRDMADPRAIPALRAALADERFTVRRVAARALRALGEDPERAAPAAAGSAP